MDVWRLVKTIGLGALRRRKRLAVLVFIGVGMILLPVAFRYGKEPPRFRTSTTILLEAKPDRIPLFQEFSPFRPLGVQLAILNSRSLAEGVLESLPKASLQDLVDNAYHVDYGLVARNAYRRLLGQEPEVESPQRRALKELQNSRVQFQTRGRDGIVHMTALASKPQVAGDILNTFVEVLLSRTRSFNVDDARVTREFLEQQLGEVKGSLKASEEALRTFTIGHGGVRVPEQSQATVVRLSQTENALVEVSANRKMIETRLNGLREKVEQDKRTAPASPATAPVAPAAPRVVPAAIQRVREQLTRLETALLDLRTKYTEEHPRVILVKDQIAELQRELAGLVKDTTPATAALSAVPPVDRVNFAQQVVTLETSLHSLSAQEAALRKQAEGLRQSLSGLSRSELEYARLTREAESSRNLYALLSDRLTAARIREQGEMRVVKVIDPPGFATPVSSNKRFTYSMLAFGVAAALGCGVPALIEWMKRPVEDEDDVTAATGLDVLAVVPRIRSPRPMFVAARTPQEVKESKRLGEIFLFTEAFRNLRVAVQLGARTQKLDTLLVTSAYPGEGKSTVVLNLGLAFGEIGRRVVLADTDFLRPTLHTTLEVKQGGGLAEVLQTGQGVERALAPVRETVWLAPRGSNPPADTRGMLATERLTGVLEEMRNQADLVICDSSPVLVIQDNLFLAAAVDGVILVARFGHTNCRDLARAKVLLESVGARPLGVVINEMPAARIRRYYKRYYTYYVRQEAS